MKLEKLIKSFNKVEKENGRSDRLQLKYQKIELHANGNTLKFNVSHFKVLADYYILEGSNEYSEPLKKELYRLYNLYSTDNEGVMITVPLKDSDRVADWITARVLDEPDSSGNGSVKFFDGEYNFSVFDQK